MLYDFVGVPLAGQGAVDQVYTQSSHSFLLQLCSVVEHADVNQDPVGVFPAPGKGVRETAYCPSKDNLSPFRNVVIP